MKIKSPMIPFILVIIGFVSAYFGYNTISSIVNLEQLEAVPGPALTVEIEANSKYYLLHNDYNNSYRYEIISDTDLTTVRVYDYNGSTIIEEYYIWVISLDTNEHFFIEEMPANTTVTINDNQAQGVLRLEPGRYTIETIETEAQDVDGFDLFNGRMIGLIFLGIAWAFGVMFGIVGSVISFSMYRRHQLEASGEYYREYTNQADVNDYYNDEDDPFSKFD